MKWGEFGFIDQFVDIDIIGFHVFILYCGVSLLAHNEAIYSECPKPNLHTFIPKKLNVNWVLNWDLNNWLTYQVSDTAQAMKWTFIANSR